jgi:hypothetical protein
MDGEGHIGLVKRGQAMLDSKIVIGNTFKPLIDYLKSVCPLTSHILIRRHKGNSKTCYLFCLNGPHVASFLHALLPFLIIKKQQAKLVLDFSELPFDERRYDHQGKAFLLAIHTLNARGITVA